MASNFEFYSPTRVIFGKGTEQRVGALVREYGGTRVLIVYGGKSAVRSGVLDRAEKSLAEAGISSWTLGGVVPNPHLDKVYEGIRIGKENSIDFLLAVGGGSVIDTAKAIAYGLAEPEKDVWELYEHTRTARKCLPVASILTIAAAGSETSNSSVITRVDTHQKRAYNDDISRPKFALMDPELTKTLPDYQTESGCADIMMHTMERYFTNGGNMELTDALAEGLLRTVMKNALILHTDPANYEARAEVMWAGSLSHNGLTGCGIASGDFMSHKLEHEMGGIWTLFSGPRRLLPRGIPLSRAPVGACEGPPAHRCADSRSRHGHLPCGGGPLRHLRTRQQHPASAHPAGGVLAAALAGGSGSFREPDCLSLRRLLRHDGSLHPAFCGAQCPG